MKTGSLYIDGIDVYKEFGMYIVKDGYNSLLSYPSLKKYDYNDWQEYDGIEADFSTLSLDTKEVSIKFAVPRGTSALFDLIDLLTSMVYHEFNFAEIGRTYRLRLTQQPNLINISILGHATLKFADDFPLSDYNYQPPASHVTENYNYTIDDIPFSAYGVSILKGSLDEISKTASIKQNLLRNIQSKSGVDYDTGANITFKSKDVKLTCLMRARRLPELWCNYDALLFDLTRPCEHYLWVDEIGESFPFIYKNGNVSKFIYSDKPWLQFSLTLTVTDYFHSNEIFLHTENDIPITLQDNDAFISIY